MLCRTTRALTPLLASFKWKLINQLLCSLDLMTSDFHLFLHLKRFLAGKNFDSDDELKERVEKRLKSHVADFYEQGIEYLLVPFTKRASVWMVIMSKITLRCAELGNI